MWCVDIRYITKYLIWVIPQGLVWTFIVSSAFLNFETICSTTKSSWIDITHIRIGAEWVPPRFRFCAKTSSLFFFLNCEDWCLRASLLKFLWICFDITFIFVFPAYLKFSISILFIYFAQHKKSENHTFNLIANSTFTSVPPCFMCFINLFENSWSMSLLLCRYTHFR